MMEQYLRQRIDCPPPGGTRTLIEEKDGIIKKQQDELTKLQQQLKTIQAERDYFFSLLSSEQKLIVNESQSTTLTSTERLDASLLKMATSLDIHSSTPSTSSSSSTINAPLNAYELSQDLHDKQIEMLEKKYGGTLRCRRAATIIQRAYRQYKLEQNFRHLCATIKTNKRLSCTFIDRNNNHQQMSTLKPLKPCLRMTPSTKTSTINARHDEMFTSSSNTPTNAESFTTNFADRHLDLPSINFEHFIETTKPPEISNHRKRVCIVTDPPIAKDQHDNGHDNDNDDDPLDNLSDFVDEHSTQKPLVLVESNERSPLTPTNGHSNPFRRQLTLTPTVDSANFYKNFTDSPLHLRKSSGAKPMPPVRSLSLKPRPTLTQANNTKTSPIWKRKISLTINTDDYSPHELILESPNHSLSQRLSPSSTNSSDRDNMSLQSTSSGSNSCSLSASFDLHAQQQQHQQPLLIEHQPVLQGQERTSNIRVNEIYRRRCYRAGLNIFNKKPERGIRYLIAHRFLESNPPAVARFLLSRKGLSRQMIGEYLGNLQDPFAMQVLHAFVNEYDFHNMSIDVALRKFQSSFRLPGEAQKIEQLMKIFSQRYCATNASSNVDTTFILAFAIIMLNTDLHSRNIKAEKKMRLEQFIKNLRAIDDGEDLDINYLTSIYERIRAEEFRPDHDHVSQVAKFDQTLIGKKPNLIAPHRRLVCYCRLYEVYDISKRERLTSHQREVFLFNDLLVITKISGKKRQQIQYQFRQAFRLSGMNLYLFETTHYQYGIRLVRKPDRNQTNLITFNARNEHDRSKFCEDLKEAIMEMDEMEGLRIQCELDKLRGSWSSLLDVTNGNGSSNANSNGATISSLIDYPTNKRDRPLSRTLSSSLLDMTLTMGVVPSPTYNPHSTTNPRHELVPCRNSQCSLDSGMVSLTNEFSPNNAFLVRSTTTK